MGKNLIKLVTGIALVLMSFLVGGCGSKEKEDEIRIGYFNNLTHAQALYMKAQGSLEENFGEEVKVKWTAFNAGPAEVEALFAGQIDIGYIGPVPAITANVKSEEDIVILSGATMAGAELITSDSSAIESIKDLDGKIVAIPQIGNTQHLCLLKLLADNGLETVEKGGTVTITAVENADVQNMLSQGNIDAALVPEPWGTTLVEQGARIVLDYDQVYRSGNYPVAVVVVRKDFLEVNQNLVESFLQIHEDTTQYVRENRAEAAAVINEEIREATGKQISEDILSKAFDRMKFATDLDEEVFSEFGEICIEQGFINKKYENLYAEFWEE